jgi:hypothetical protein
MRDILAYLFIRAGQAKKTFAYLIDRGVEKDPRVEGETIVRSRERSSN